MNLHISRFPSALSKSAVEVVVVLVVVVVVVVVEKKFRVSYKPGKTHFYMTNGYPQIQY